MKRYIAISILIIVLLSSKVFGFESFSIDSIQSRPETTARQLCFLFMLFEDWKQTKDIKNQPISFVYEEDKTVSVKHYEGNKILGKFPSSKDIDLYFAFSAIAHTGITYLLPEKYAKVWQCAWIGVQTKTIDNNYEQQNKSSRLEYNLKFDFKF